MTLEYLDTVIAFGVVMLGVSLLITILTQMASGLFGLRGTNLLWGLRTLFQSIDPRLAAHAEAILRDPLLSDSAFSKFKERPVIGWLLKRWKLASAVRPDELVRALTRVSAELRKTDPAGANLIDGVLGDSDPEAARKLRMLSDAFRNLQPGYAVQVDKMVQQLWEQSRQSLGKLETLFNTVMDRVSQRFALQMRVWTVVFAVLVAFAAHLDSLRLLEQLSFNPEMRASLVNSREALMKEAAAVVAAPESGPQTLPASVEPQAYAAALAALKEKQPEATKDIEVPPAFDNLPAAVAWLEPRLKADEAGRKNLLAEYKSLVSTELTRSAEAIRDRLESSGWQLIPSPYPWFDYRGKRHFLGILISAAFLSLGAPFWFNLLKTLGNLRPTLASRQAKEQGAAG